MNKSQRLAAAYEAGMKAAQKKMRVKELTADTVESQIAKYGQQSETFDKDIRTALQKIQEGLWDLGDVGDRAKVALSDYDEEAQKMGDLKYAAEYPNQIAEAIMNLVNEKSKFLKGWFAGHYDQLATELRRQFPSQE